jgi:hypothetical protein
MGFTVKLEQKITNRDIAEEFVGTYADDQAEMLCAMAGIVSTWSLPWAFQCRAISNKMPDARDRSAVIDFLMELVEHLRDYQDYREPV